MVARLAAVCAVLLMLFACASAEEGPWMIEDSTYRIGAPEQTGDKPDLKMQVFTDRVQCRASLGEAKADLCVPQVDRATGQVRLSFRLLDRETQLPYDLPLSPDHVKISHNKSPVTEGPKRGVELIRHDPRRTGQLFIVLIDGSGSMWDGEEGKRVIDKVYAALLKKKVKEAFFPKEVVTGVVLMRFSGEKPTGLDGGPPIVLENGKHYEEDIRSFLYSSDRGWTHLYSAVSYSIGDLMEEPSIKDWLGIHKAEPTIIALTDGFNNQKGDDTCATNVPRLQSLIEEVDVARNQPLGLRPSIFTVGLGYPINPDFDTVPRGKVTVRELCGKHKNTRIDGHLEMMGIDNVSLKWIAARGGGASFVKRKTTGLAAVFEEAAAKRYGWYTMYYKVDKFHHRQSFETRIQLTSYANAEATIRIYPSAWLDAPTGDRPDGKRWAAPTPLRSTFALVMPLLGVLVFLRFLGPASFNARRAITRRARGGAKSPAPSAVGDPQQPTQPLQ